MKKLFITLSLSLIIIAAHGQDDLSIIKSKITAFSAALMSGDTLAVNSVYATDGKILPNGSPILDGHSLKEYWNKGIRNGQIYYLHKVSPEEIKVLGEYAYDYGYYEGESGSENNRSKWKGKYVIIWKKVAEDWKIYLDIWNGVPLND